jgi:hypothetical protein
VSLVLPPSPANAQNRWPPDSLRNLKVFPASTTVPELVATMRRMTSALGVRCQFCHVGREGQPLDSFNFVSDDKRTKETARVMLRMVQEINQHQLPGIPERPSPAVEVTCMTCHRGVSRPIPLGTLLVQALETAGPDSARRAYQQLRARYHGRSAYDFGEPSLVGTAQDLARVRRYGEALVILQINDEQFPTSANTMNNIGDVHLARGDTSLAISSFRMARARDSTDAVSRSRLRALGQQP